MTKKPPDNEFTAAELTWLREKRAEDRNFRRKTTKDLRPKGSTQIASAVFDAAQWSKALTIENKCRGRFELTAAQTTGGDAHSMSQLGLGCVKTPKLNLRIESLS